MKSSKVLCFLLLVLLLPIVTNAEPLNIRTIIAKSVDLSSLSEEGTAVNIFYNEAVAIEYTEENIFLEGIEFELRIPKIFYGSESSIIWTAYSELDPTAKVNHYDYTANELFSQPLPSRVSMNLVFPLIENNNLENNAYVVLIPIVITKEQFPVLFKLSSVGKGLSSAMEKAKFKLIIKPVFRDEGGLVINLNIPNASISSPLNVYIDNKLVENSSDVIFVEKGTHSIRVYGDTYKEELVTTVIEPGKINTIDIMLTSNMPIISFDAPQGSYIAIDGKQVSDNDINGLEIDPGEHNLYFKFGDYILSRKFMAVRGKKYQMVLSVDLDIISNP